MSRPQAIPGLHAELRAGLEVAPGALAWFGRLDEIARLTRLAATELDLADVGARSGEALRRFLERRSVLRHLVSSQLDLDPQSVLLGYDRQGAPRVRMPQTDIFVSVAGRASWAAFAVGRRPVGVDIEPLEPELDLPWAVLNAEERGRLEGLALAERHAAFLRHWTAKEAYLKMLGVGLMRDPAAVSVRWPGGHRFSILDASIVLPGGWTGALPRGGAPTAIGALFVDAGKQE